MSAPWYLFGPIYALHLFSSITTISVIYSVFRHDVLNIVAKICLLNMYFSSFFTDISYSFSLWCKVSKGQILFTIEDVQTEDGQPGICYQPLFYHEMGFSLFAFGILITATERLINSQTNFYLRKKMTSLLIVIVTVGIAGCCSYFWVVALLNISTSLAASIAAFSFFSIAMGQLFLAVRCNIHNYRNGVGQSLDRRFTSATLYYFNRQLLISLMGEVTLRVTAYCGIFIITLGVYENVAFGWLSFGYHNLIPVGNLIFPWLLILTRKSARRNLFKNKVQGVTDLTGNAINMQNGSADHYKYLQKMWS